jgi:hypothetical protein
MMVIRKNIGVSGEVGKLGTIVAFSWRNREI